MNATTCRPTEADPGVDACPLDPNDQLLKEPIDENWIDIADDRICREFVRQLQQLENAAVTTNRDSRLANARALESFQRSLERMARRVTTRDVRRANKDASNPHDAILALERRIYPLLEQALAEKNSRDIEG